MFYKTSRIFLIFLFLLSNTSLAEGLLEDDFFSGFSGRIEISFYTIITNSNLIPFDKDEYDFTSDDNSTNDRLEKNSKYYIAGNLSVPFNVEYTFESGTIAYMGTHFYDDTREGLFFGVEKELSSMILDVSIFGDVNDVWQDPFSTSKRELAEEIIAGVDIYFNQIMTTGINIGLKSKYRYVDEDLSGDQYEDLERNGFIHTLSLDYDHLFDKGENNKNSSSILFKSGFTYADIDGLSNSYKSVLLGLKGTIWYEEISVALSSIYEGRRYKKIHPIFGKIREDDQITNGIIVTFHNLGKSKKWYLTGVLSVSNVFSNIDFYSSDSYLLLSSLGYNF